MNVPIWLWFATLGTLLGIILIDLYIFNRKPHAISIKEAGFAVACYVSLAILFGFGVFLFSGPAYGGQFFAGYITEYSLSVDNLFIFLIIMSRFAVPREYQHMVLLIGILLALVLRGAFIAAGAAAISHFQWVFFLFGAILLYTAYTLMRQDSDEEEEFKENAVLRAAKRVLPATERYHGMRLSAVVDGRRVVTPMLIVMLAIGTTDVMFALDSIPAIFGLTKEPFLVFTANAFALMGLRQLYFLLGGLLERLVYLSKGLALILAFIGVKLTMEALHGVGLEEVPHVPIWLSLTVIIATLAVTTVASVIKSRRDAAAQYESR